MTTGDHEKPQPLTPTESVAEDSRGNGTPRRGEVALLDATTNGTPRTAARPVVSSIPDVTGLLRALRRRWLLAFTAGLVCAAIAGATAWYLTQTLKPPQYTAYALIKFALRPPRIIFPNTAGDTGYSRNTHITLIKSSFVMQATLRRPGIAELETIREQEDPVDWLGKQIKAAYVGGSEIFRISLTGERPADLAAIVNAVKDAYMDEIVNAERNQRLAHLRDLQKVQDQFEAKTKEQRRQLKDLSQRLGTNSTETATLKQRMELEHQAALRSEHSRISIELARAQVLIGPERRRSAAALAELTVPEATIEQYVESDPTVQQLRMRAAAKQTLIADYERKAANKDAPTLVRYRNELGSLQATLESRRAEIRPSITERVSEIARREAEATVKQLQEKIDLLTEQERSFRQQIEERAVEVKTIGIASSDMEFLRAEIAEADEIRKTAATALERLQVELEAPASVTQLQAAEPPRNKDVTQDARIVALSAIGTLGFIVLVIAWWDFRAHRIDAPHDVEDRLGIRVIGALPALPRTAGRLLSNSNGSAGRHWSSVLSESIDGIRMMLLHDARVATTRVVMVGSALGREGKTTLASHLATSLGRAERRTVLIDCDLRRPATHLVFDLPLQPGFSDLIRGTADLADVIRPTQVRSLSVIPAGDFDSQAIQMLSKDALPDIFNRLREEYEFVIVDSAPLLPVVDSLLVAQHVDGVIISILHDVSQVAAVYSACDRLARLGVRILGAVVNGVQDGRGYGYHYFGNYGYQYDARANARGAPQKAP